MKLETTRQKNRVEKKFHKICLKTGLVLMMALILSLTGGDLQNAGSLSGATQASAAEYTTVTNKKEQINVLRRGMLKRKREIKIRFKGKYKKLYGDLNEILDECFKDSSVDSSDAGDYVLFHISRLSGTGNYSAATNECFLVYNIEYRDTLKQVKAVDTKVKNVLSQLGVSGMTNYGKIKAIHDYIVNNADYDLTLMRYTAYTCLIEQSSVCQGYALLTYKMMMEAGIPCRIVTGYGNTELHAWNIVKLQGKWYNIDCTWDDPVSADGTKTLSYDYFLKCPAEFDDTHTRDEEYTTKAFNAKYPMADRSFTAEMDNGDRKTVKPVSVKKVTVKKKKTLKKGKTFKLKAKIKPKNAVNANFVYKTSKKSVAKVSSKGVVKAVGAGNAKITVVTANGKKAVCKVTVKK